MNFSIAAGPSTRAGMVGSSSTPSSAKSAAAAAGFWILDLGEVSLEQFLRGLHDRSSFSFSDWGDGPLAERSASSSKASS
jgi:hypothetical protein